MLKQQYTPQFDATVHTSTVVHRHSTQHTDWIDWDNYPFDDPDHTNGMRCSEEQKRENIERLKGYLAECEKFNEAEVFASTYGGWPRIWCRVIGVGMASAWPYWTPRPTVIVEGTLGVEWFDWRSLTGAMTKPTTEG